jgi:hypothetical protein
MRSLNAASPASVPLSSGRFVTTSTARTAVSGKPRTLNSSAEMPPSSITSCNTAAIMASVPSSRTRFITRSACSM